MSDDAIIDPRAQTLIRANGLGGNAQVAASTKAKSSFVPEPAMTEAEVQAEDARNFPADMMTTARVAALTDAIASDGSE